MKEVMHDLGGGSESIEFNKYKYLELKQEYEKAVEEEKDLIIYEGREILTSYCKYLLEYLSKHYEDKRGNH